MASDCVEQQTYSLSFKPCLLVQSPISLINHCSSYIDQRAKFWSYCLSESSRLIRFILMIIWGFNSSGHLSWFWGLRSSSLHIIVNLCIKVICTISLTSFYIQIYIYTFRKIIIFVFIFRGNITLNDFPLSSTCYFLSVISI